MTTRTPVNVTPLRPRGLRHDRNLDVRLLPGSLVRLPDSPQGIGCTAVLIDRNAPNADGVRDEPGMHDWLIVATDDPADTDMVGTVQTYRVVQGSTLVRWTPELARVAHLYAEARRTEAVGA